MSGLPDQLVALYTQLSSIGEFQEWMTQLYSHRDESSGSLHGAKD